VNRPLFVPYGNMPDIGFDQFIVDIRYRSPRVAEDNIDALFLERPQNNFCAVQFDGNPPFSFKVKRS
jgi:hypothetical protein